MNKTLVGIIVGVLVLGGLIWIARPNDQNTISSVTSSKILPDGQRTLTIEEAKNYDFGTISMAQGIVKHQFKIKNTSDETVVINKMYTSCMCTTAELLAGGKQFGPYSMPGHGVIPKIQGTVNPNEEMVVEVVFDPAAHGPAGIGRIQRTIILENNVGQPIELQFTAIVTP